ncbi:MAG: AraC family transcriptional regulator [Proteobacteria bacterium]|nr:AraC family transcriptional regulator [Pseudomonadota bacterium]
MSKPDTTRDYGRRIERVVAFIGAHLDDPLDLGRLAEVACFSPYHFHRVYRAIAGETTADTLRRLRLHRAAYGATPAAYRKRGRLVSVGPIPVTQESLMYEVSMRELAPVRLAALRHVGPYMGIGPVFERLSAWAGGRGLIGPSTRAFGIYYDNPEAVPANQLRSDAGITVGPQVEVDGDVRLIDLAGGRHAVFVHKGPYAELESAYRWACKQWLPQSGEEPADRPCFEEYLNDCRALPPAEWLTAICLPLAERGRSAMAS